MIRTFAFAAFAAPSCLAAALLLAGAAAAQPASGPSPTLERIKARGAIVFAYREVAAPFSSRGPDGNPVGYSVDICNEVADEIRRALEMPKLPVRWLPVTALSRFLVTDQGLADAVCGTTSVTLERMAMVDFSLITFVTGARLLIPAAAGEPDLRKIGAATVGVQANTTSARALEAYIKANDLPVRVRAVKNAEDALAQIDRGDLMGYVSDFILLRDIQMAPRHRGKYRVGGEFLSYDPYALVLPRDDTTFRTVVNRRIARLFTGKGIHQIHDRWFKGLEAAMPALLAYAIAVQSIPER